MRKPHEVSIKKSISAYQLEFDQHKILISKYNYEIGASSFSNVTIINLRHMRQIFEVRYTSHNYIFLSSFPK